MGRVVAKLSLFVDSDDLIMVGRRWLWMVVVKEWLIVGARGWWWQNYGQS